MCILRSLVKISSSGEWVARPMPSSPGIDIKTTAEQIPIRSGAAAAYCSSLSHADQMFAAGGAASNSQPSRVARHPTTDFAMINRWGYAKKASIPCSLSLDATSAMQVFYRSLERRQLQGSKSCCFNESQAITPISHGALPAVCPQFYPH